MLGHDLAGDDGVAGPQCIDDGLRVGRVLVVFGLDDVVTLMTVYQEKVEMSMR
jgi:hypothetical protein